MPSLVSRGGGSTRGLKMDCSSRKSSIYSSQMSVSSRRRNRSILRQGAVSSRDGRSEYLCLNVRGWCAKRRADPLEKGCFVENLKASVVRMNHWAGADSGVTHHVFLFFLRLLCRELGGSQSPRRRSSRKRTPSGRETKSRDLCMMAVCHSSPI